MVRGMPTKVVGGCLGLGAFAIAIVCGLAADNNADEILTRAILSMLGCNLLGLAIGAVAERTIEEHLASHKALNPIAAETAAAARPPDQDEEPFLEV